MGIRVDNKIALVTGGSLGIGRGCALALAEAGADVIINYHSRREAADATVEQLRSTGRRAIAVQADVSDPVQVESMIKSVVEEFGQIDILVSNAATSTRQPFLETDIATLRRTMEVSLFGSFYVCQSVARHMTQRESGGSIIVIGSLHAMYPLPNSIDYNMAKAALHQMAMTMARELAPQHIRVNVVVPGWIDTIGERKWSTDEQIRQKGALLPWGRIGTEHDVANVALFLASDMADYVSGSVYQVDGALGVSMPGSARSRT